MKNRDARPLSVLFLLLTALGCAPAISQGMRDQAVKDISFMEVFQNPDAHKGKVVIWGGVIIKSENRKEGTLLEILQKQTDRWGMPKDIDISSGRFLALHNGYLDTAIFSRGREITVAGEIEGKRVLTLGEIQYGYPLISIKEIHLWPPRVRDDYYPPPYWYYPHPHYYYRWHYPPYHAYW